MMNETLLGAVLLLLLGLGILVVVTDRLLPPSFIPPRFRPVSPSVICCWEPLTWLLRKRL